MTRSLAAYFCLGAALFGAPAQSEAGVIPWMYDAIFGYGTHWGGGYGGGWGAPYGGYGYTTGYAPFYSASYGMTYGAAGCCGTTTNYAPWTGYSYGGACCSPCGTNCCTPCGSGCGTSCDPGCSNCPGGNCATGSSGTNAVPSSPADTGAGTQPTYVPPINTNDKTLPADHFGPARSRDNLGSGSSIPTTGGSGNPGGSTVDPNSQAPPPEFAPGQPGYFDKKDDQSRENGAVMPKLNPIQPGEKVAFKTPPRFSRTTLPPVFELPTIVSAPPRTLPEAPAVPTAVASK